MAGLAVQYSLHAMLLCNVFPVSPFYQFLVYAVILSCLLWTIMFSGVTDCAHPVHSFLFLSIVGIVYVLSFYRIFKILQDDFLETRKIPESDFGWTKSSQKPLSRWKWFYAPLVRLPVFYSGSNESNLAHQFKWLDNTSEGLAVAHILEKQISSNQPRLCFVLSDCLRII